MTEPVVAGYHSFVRIGRGGLGDVYRAVDATTGRAVAVKVLRDVADSSLAWHRTRRELAALEALHGHPHVIESVAVVEVDTHPALVMEYAAGGSVADLMARRRSAGRSIAVAEATFVARQTAMALAAAHARGIVHRDVKPQNLLIDAAGQIKLCDFGIAALTHDDEYRTRTNAVSMRYASPEDLEHDQPVGPPSDVYSLGATLRHLVHGAPPSLRDRLARWIPPATDDARLTALDAVIARCLEPQPELRPTAEQLLDELARLAAGDVTPLTALDVAADVATPTGPLIVLADSEPWPRDATTVRRPLAAGLRQEQPVLVTRPKIAPASRRTTMFVGVTCAAAVVALIATVAVLRLRGGEAHAADAPRTEPRPSTLTALVDADWSTGDVGECLVQVAGATELEVVACDQPHDLERFAAGDLSDDTAEGQIGAGVDAACANAFERYVGGSAESSLLDVAETRPSSASWEAGDRSYGCFLGIENERLTASAVGTGW
jgi:hypothetical protein